jgi:Tol biopolymer transport system component
MANPAKRRMAALGAFLVLLSISLSAGERPDPGVPPNLNAGAFQPIVERMWRGSPTFRRQCSRLAAEPQLTVSIRADVTSRRSTRAESEMARRRGALVRADIVLHSPRDAVELIAHEVEHIIEQLDGAEPQRTESCEGHANLPGIVETCRAVEAGRRVAREVEEAGAARTLTLRQANRHGQPVDSSAQANVSANGRFVVFASSARLLPADRNDLTDLYTMDLETRRLTLESSRPGWADNAVNVGHISVSADGRLVVVQVDRIDDAAPAKFRSEVVLLDRATGSAQAVDAGAASPSSDRHHRTPAISADGTAVVFESIPLRGHGSGQKARSQIYLVRLATGTAELVGVAGVAAADLSRMPETGSRIESSLAPSISADGRYVAFVSRADPECADSSCAAKGSRGPRSAIYVRDTVGGVTTLASKSAKRGPPNGAAFWPSISADGRFVVFVSEASNLVKGDGNGAADVFLHDTATGTTELVSRRPDGKPGNAASQFPSVTADGNTIAFQSLASDLVCLNRCSTADRDINLLWDVFVWQRGSGIIRASADSRDEWMAPSHRPMLAAGGRVLIFASRQPADDKDVDHDDDLFVQVRALSFRERQPIQDDRDGSLWGEQVGEKALPVTAHGVLIPHADSLIDVDLEKLSRWGMLERPTRLDRDAHHSTVRPEEEQFAPILVPHRLGSSSD